MMTWGRGAIRCRSGSGPPGASPPGCWACATGDPKPSHVLTAIGLTAANWEAGDSAPIIEGALALTGQLRVDPDVAVKVAFGNSERAEVNGKNLVLNVGYSHPVVIEPPQGIYFDTDAKTRQVKVMGYDKQMVGQVAADIRKVRPPEPYQGKGIKYLEEKIRRKAGKAGKV